MSQKTEKNNRLFQIERGIFIDTIVRFRIWKIVSEGPKSYTVTDERFGNERRRFLKEENGLFTNGVEAAEAFLKASDEARDVLNKRLADLKKQTSEVRKALMVARRRNEKVKIKGRKA